MQWIGVMGEGSDKEDMFVLRKDDGKESDADIAVVWGIECNTRWFWYIVNQKGSDAYPTAIEAKEAAVAAVVASRMES